MTWIRWVPGKETSTPETEREKAPAPESAHPSRQQEQPNTTSKRVLPEKVSEDPIYHPPRRPLRLWDQDANFHLQLHRTENPEIPQSTTLTERTIALLAEGNCTPEQFLEWSVVEPATFKRVQHILGYIAPAPPKLSLHLDEKKRSRLTPPLYQTDIALAMLEAEEKLGGNTRQNLKLKDSLTARLYEIFETALRVHHGQEPALDILTERLLQAARRDATLQLPAPLITQTPITLREYHILLTPLMERLGYLQARVRRTLLTTIYQKQGQIGERIATRLKEKKRPRDIFEQVGKLQARPYGLERFVGFVQAMLKDREERVERFLKGSSTVNEDIQEIATQAYKHRKVSYGNLRTYFFFELTGLPGVSWTRYAQHLAR